ncbi:MAG: TonB-dependent receptor [Cellvibrionales bacterium]|nr:TonB-dependent receptor [Cellvibrionales bacterium]
MNINTANSNGLSKCLVVVITLCSLNSHAQNSNEDSAIEEVVVYSIRKSLESALAEKREKVNLTEIINADDIGKLPDENVAEVLENIPGVQITRDAGIGDGVSIRGSDQNRVEMNGRGTTPSGDSRGGISFSDLPAALVKSLHVVKVPSADMVEGSLGGTINVKTYRGLSLKKPLKVISLKSEYAQNAEDWNRNFSFTVGDKFSTGIGEIGAILTVSHIDKSIRQDSIRVSPSVRKVVDKYINSTYSLPDGDNDPDPYYYPGYSEISSNDEERENTALSGSLEWRAAPGLKFFVEGSYSDFSKRGRGQMAITQPADISDTCTNLNTDRETDSINPVVIDGIPVMPQATFDVINVEGLDIGIMTSGMMGGGIRNCRADVAADYESKPTNDGVQIKTKNVSGIRDTKSHIFALGGEWVGDNVEVKFELSGASSKTSTPSFQTIFQYNNPEHLRFLTGNGKIRMPMFYDTRGDYLQYGPLEDAVGRSSSFVAGTTTFFTFDQSALLDPKNYALFLAKDLEGFFDNDLYAQKVDAKWDFDHKFLSGLSAGVRTSQRSNSKQRSSAQTSQYPGITALQLEEAFPGFMEETEGDLFSNAGGGLYLDEFVTASSEVIFNQREAVREFLSLEVDLDPLQSFEVEEDTAAAYIKADFFVDVFDIPVRGNVGVRVITTEQVASGKKSLTAAEMTSSLEAQGFDYTDLLEEYSQSGSVSSQTVADLTAAGFSSETIESFFNNGLSSIDESQSYTNVLPSASLVISPIEKMQIRLGYAEILRRPNFSQLSPTAVYPLDNSPVNVGNPSLKPTTAQQYDLTFEYYFRKGSVFSLGYFYKDLDSVIGKVSTPRGICNVNASSSGEATSCNVGGIDGGLVTAVTPTNLPGGTIEGFEIALQHSFIGLPQPFDGLGIIANYAYQKGERGLTFSTPGYLSDEGLEPDFPLNFVGLSENSYNLTVYYDKPRFPLSGRLRYTYRDEFLQTEVSDVTAGLPLYTAARGQLNASMSYKINKTFSLNFSGVNLTKEPVIHRAIFSTGPIGRMRDPDRRFSIGIRGRF